MGMQDGKGMGCRMDTALSPLPRSKQAQTQGIKHSGTCYWVRL